MEKIKEVKLSEDQINLLKNGDLFIGPNGQKWYHLPFWYCKRFTDSNTLYEVYHVDSLPEKFVDALNDHKEGKGFIIYKEDTNGKN